MDKQVLHPGREIGEANPKYFNENALRVVAVRRETGVTGEISLLKLSDGREVTRDTAYDMVKNGELYGMVAGVSKDGEKYVRSYPDFDPDNNLADLPSF